MDRISLPDWEAFFMGMIGKVVKGVFAALVVFGALMLVLDVSKMFGDGKQESVAAVAVEKVAPVKPVESLAPVVFPEPPKISAAAGCECDAGGVCVGPRGGKYCLTKTGSKKYL